ncbi:hypothetical protein CPB86DRAFT_428878 [Serendipita vermifera]|nr:hypothetical protein CPB86DRAFT_428878 [Serendipita vermifera]
MRIRLPPFTVSWVTGLTTATFICTFASLVWVQEVLPSAPDQDTALRSGINLDAAWTDIQTIARKPHPSNSRENDVVRAYLLSRVNELSERYPNLHVADDLTSNTTFVGTYLKQKVVTYFEGSNVLIKVDGRNGTLPAVLFSAHFDSSATAPGATDDGLGVVSLLSLMEQFARNPPLRNTIFNLNNGEEDWLCGSHVFFQHPWSKEASVFLNLEGAGAGGRPILFRGSTTQLVKATQKLKHPHGTVTSSDAYALGLIKSMTDYEVYAKQGNMKGLDISFYLNRDKYHTMADTVESMKGKAPLWIDLELTKDVGYALANLEEDGDDGKAVYWDIMGRRMIVFSLDSLLRRLPRLVFSMTALVAALAGYLWYKGQRVGVSREWLHLPISLLSGIIGSGLVVTLYCKTNPLSIYSAPYSIIISLTTAIVLSLLCPLWYLGHLSSANATDQKTSISLQYFVLMSILLIGYIRIIQASGFGGFYFLEQWYGGAAFAVVLDLGKRVWDQWRNDGNKTGSTRPITSREGDVTEPLLEMDTLQDSTQDERHHRNAIHQRHIHVSNPQLWALEFLFCIIPVWVLVLPLVLIVCAGLGQTLGDGSAAVVVYAGITVLLFLSILPLVPFAHRLSTHVYFAVAALFVLSTLYNLLSFPFSADKRIKFFVSQHYNLDYGSNSVQLLGVQPYLQQALGSVPSASQDPQLEFSINSLRKIGEATWSGPIPRLFGPNAEGVTAKGEDSVASSARRIDAHSAIFTVKGTDTKSCILKFDQPIIDIQVRHLYGEESNGIPASRIPEESPYPIPPEGATVVSLWSRTWNPEFEVIVKWNATEDENSAKKEGKHGSSFWRRIFSSREENLLPKTGRIGCQYADNGENQLAVLNELFEHLPSWATITTSRALLVADRRFSI